MHHIRTIRQNHGLELPDADPQTQQAIVSMRENMERALTCLSTELYSKDTHFILEFIQNADDNKYAPGVSPQLCVELIDREVVISCNETGFTRENVEAICGIGDSTKRTRNTEGYIGEKGIGFKSVFKVADVVYISSTQYTFKLDKKKSLGMITPEWATEYPVVEGWTHFRLLLSKKIHVGELITQLQDIHLSLLLFLRKLSSVTIRTTSAGTVTTHEFHRTDRQSTVANLKKVVNGVTDSRNYLLVKHMVKAFTGEEKRQGIERSEIILAFPLEADETPYIDEEQYVYAFLPLRRYGFRFVIQSDFLVSANREDVLADLQWNKNLQSGVVDAFMTAVNRFLEHPTLRTTWFRFLPNCIPDPFFRFVEDKIFEKLSNQPIFRIDFNRHRPPSAVVMLSEDFSYEDGSPLIPEAQLPGGLVYLPSDYDAERDDLFLRRLGVCQMSYQHFLDGLKLMDRKRLIPGQSGPWHEAVCRTILKYQQGGFSHAIRSLSILPLYDKMWVPATTLNVYFDSSIAGIPRDLDFHVLDPEIEPQSSRYQLYAALGVRVADPHVVARKIMTMHQQRPMRLQRSELLQHARFMFTHRSSRHFPTPTGLHVRDQRGTVKKACEVYMDHPNVLGPSRLKKILKHPARFLHEDYLKENPAEDPKAWWDWLRDDLKVNTVPRIVGGSLSPEFLDLANSLDTLPFLTVLKDCWPHLSDQAVPDAPFVSQLAGVIVSCENGMRQPIKYSYLKTRLLSRIQDLPFLPVTQADDPQWQFLIKLGVTVERNGSFFVKRLLQHKQTGCQDHRRIWMIYRHLEARFDDDAPGIRDAFQTQNLIFRPTTLDKPAAWIAMSDAVWSGHQSTITKTALKPLYRDLERFFLHHLKVSDAPPQLLVDDMKALIAEWKGKSLSPEAQKQISLILRDISDMMDSSSGSLPWLEELKDEPIFPVSHGGKVTLCKQNQFYIPDLGEKLSRIFASKVPLLSIPISVQQIDPLLKALEQDARRIEKAVDRSYRSTGQNRPDAGKTRAYSGRLKFVRRYLHSQARSKEYAQPLTRLRTLDVVSVESIVSTIKLDGVVKTQPERLALKIDNSSKATVLMSRSIPPEDLDYYVCYELEKFLGQPMPLLHNLLCSSEHWVERYFSDHGICADLEEVADSDSEELSNTDAISDSPEDLASPLTSHAPLDGSSEQEVPCPPPNAPQPTHEQNSPPNSADAAPVSTSAETHVVQDVLIHDEQRTHDAPNTPKHLPRSSTSESIRALANAAAQRMLGILSPQATSPVPHVEPPPSAQPTSSSPSLNALSPAHQTPPTGRSFTSPTHTPPTYHTFTPPIPHLATSPSQTTSASPTQHMTPPRARHTTSTPPIGSISPPTRHTPGARTPLIPSSLSQGSLHSDEWRSPSRGNSGLIIDRTLSLGAMQAAASYVHDDWNALTQTEPTAAPQRPVHPVADDPSPQRVECEERQTRDTTEVGTGNSEGPSDPLPGATLPPSVAGMGSSHAPFTLPDRIRPEMSSDFASHPSDNASAGASRTSEEDSSNGVLGELCVYHCFSRALPSFSLGNWTSELRGEVPGVPPYDGPSMADFVYDDTTGYLTALLFGPEMAECWKNQWPRYYLEVKSTSSGQTTPFHLSRQQFQTAAELTLTNCVGPPRHLYVIVRVWGLPQSFSYGMYPDPFGLLGNGHMRVTTDVGVQLVVQV